MKASITRALGFLVAAAAVGAVAGRLVRAFWNERIAGLPFDDPWSTFDAVFSDLQEALLQSLGILAVLGVHAALLGWVPRPRSRASRLLARETILLLALCGGSFVWSPSRQGFGLWAGTALTALLLRVCLLAVQLCVGVAWREPPTSVWLYLVGRCLFTWCYVAGLALRGENALYGVVPLGGLALEVLLVGLLLGIRFGSRRWSADANGSIG